MKIARFMLAATLASVSTASYGLIDIQALVGKRWGEGEVEKNGDKRGFAGKELVFAAHIAPLPIPMVTLGVGPAISYTMWDNEDFGADITKATSLDLGAEVFVAVKIPFLLEPYAKLNYTFSSNTVIEGKVEEELTGKKVDYASKSKGSGTALSLGFRTSIVPLVSLIVEGKMYDGKEKEDSVEIGGIKDSTNDNDETKIKSKSMLVGLDIGF